MTFSLRLIVFEVIINKRDFKLFSSNKKIIDIQSKQNLYFLTLNIYMFPIEYSIIRLIQDLIADKMHLHAVYIVYSITLCLLWDSTSHKYH
jgi:hypothetical protein